MGFKLFGDLECLQEDLISLKRKNKCKKNKDRNNQFYIKEARFIDFFLNERNLKNKILIRKSEYLELP